MCSTRWPWPGSGRAGHAGLLSGREQLDEALALDPEAPLVSEAKRFLDGGWDTALATQPT
jgi:hypothetical protein